MHRADPSTGQERAIRVVRGIACAGLLASLMISHPLWVGETTWGRSVPAVPWVEAAPRIAQVWPWDAVLFGALCLGVLAAGAVRRGGAAMGGVIVLGVLLAAQDVFRAQPWFYQYLLMLSVLCVHAAARGGGESRWAGAGATLLALRLIICAVYVYSGLHKVNFTFINTTFSELTRPLADALGAPSWLVRTGAFAVVPMEVFIGIGALAARLRVWSALVGTAMHAGIVLCLLLTDVNANAVVLPWNAAMVAMLWVLASAKRGEPRTGHSLTRAWQWPAMVPVLVLACIMPALGLADRWPAYLSWGMYAGREPHLAIGLTEEAAAGLPAELRPYLRPVNAERIRHAVTMMDWVASETRARPFPEEWYLRALARKTVPRIRGVEGVLAILYHKPDRRTGERFEEAMRGIDLLPPLPPLPNSQPGAVR